MLADNSLKALARKVLERNTLRNMTATPPSETCNKPCNTDPLKRGQMQQQILKWLDHIGEGDPEQIESVLEQCRADPEALAYFLKRAGDVQVRI